MEIIANNNEDEELSEPVRCPICGTLNETMKYCRHVRWTFDQGDPLDFAHFALETSPYIRARGHTVRDIPTVWWDARAAWIVDRVLLHFDASDGYVFGEVGDMDLLARDVWREFRPDPVRPELIRY